MFRGAVLIAIAVSLAMSGTVSATNFWCSFDTDSQHQFAHESLGAGWYTASASGRAQLDATDMTATLWTTDIHGRDVTVYDENNGNDGAYGQAIPVSVSGSYWLHSHVVFNTYYNPSSSLMAGIACHELGHPVGR